MSVTLKDIALKTGVSLTSVSLVLNQKPNRVSKEKRQEILKTAKQLGYKVNMAARSLVQGTTKTIGFILPDLENYFFASLAQQVELILRESGYAVFIMSNNEKVMDDYWLVDQLIARGVDGLFICPSNGAMDDRVYIEKLRDIDIPVVFLDRVISGFSGVNFDNGFGARKAVEILIQSGHRRIGCIAPPFARKNGNERLNGYFEALKQADLESFSDWVVEGDYKFLSGYRAGEKLLKQKVTAIFSCNDMMTLGLCSYLMEMGIRIPQDISIISYDKVVDYFKISAMAQDIKQLSSEGCKLLLNRLENKDNEECVYIRLKPKFINLGSINNVSA